MKENQHDHLNSNNNIRVNGSAFRSPIKVESLSQTAEAAPITFVENSQRQNIPTKKQLVDHHRQGLIVEGGVGYRQTVVIRSYEVGADKTATLESILNLLQETALNHVWMSGLLSDGFGATHGMMRNDLIWVVSRMQVLIDYYPIWGEVLEIDTWVGASGKNGMRRDWLIRSKATGRVFARATSTWVMMNGKTRRLSKMPEEVRDELTPWFIEKQAIKEDGPEKIVKLDKEAKYMNSDLKPKRSDLDMNQHVNNVKYLRWMLEVDGMHSVLEEDLDRYLNLINKSRIMSIQRITKDDLIQGKALFNEINQLTDNSTVTRSAHVYLKSEHGPYYGVNGITSVYNPKVSMVNQVQVTCLFQMEMEMVSLVLPWDRDNFPMTISFMQPILEKLGFVVL
ncbi:hypothetical protein TSUD_253990 [Trifolium subterraneum]|uniref:Acyl-[acyl-carrier-protein] hydrolase n=1 Tax=Trifolium subterraneum TaxID=3900 RepID=A0A2Z6NTV8_TRISU|nr:hypothetical protein TSUD_253990 [Trifolium subterraneum]